MSDEQTGATDSGAARLARAATRTRQATDTFQGEQSIAELNLNAEHLSSVIALQSQALENADRQSEREHNAGKETHRLSFLLVIVAILAVVGIIVFLVIYKEGSLLGYILSGIGGLIAGAFGGYGYANRPR